MAVKHSQGKGFWRLVAESEVKKHVILLLNRFLGEAKGGSQPSTQKQQGFVKKQHLAMSKTRDFAVDEFLG